MNSVSLILTLCYLHLLVTFHCLKDANMVEKISSLTQPPILTHPNLTGLFLHLFQYELFPTHQALYQSWNMYSMQTISVLNAHFLDT